MAAEAKRRQVTFLESGTVSEAPGYRYATTKVMWKLKMMVSKRNLQLGSIFKSMRIDGNFTGMTIVNNLFVSQSNFLKLFSVFIFSISLIPLCSFIP